MPVVLDVRPSAFSEVAARFGGVIGDLVRLCYVQLSWSLADAAGMAGSDPAGLDWARSYDGAVADLLAGIEGTGNACYRLAALLDRSGHNHAAAEAASGPSPELPPAPRDWQASRFSVTLPPSAAAGGVGPLPGAWHLISSAVGRVWPDGHQDRLRAAALAWHRAAAELGDLAATAATATAPLLDQRSPEIPDVLAVCASMRTHLDELRRAATRLGDACSDYAAHLDAAHAAAEHELVRLADESVAIQVAGGVLAFFTAGLAEVPTQAVEAARLAVTATRVAAVVDDVAAFVRIAAAVLTDIGAELAALTRRVAPLLRRREVVTVTEAVVLPGTRAAPEAVAASRLELELGPIGPASETWADLRTLDGHLRNHGADFGVDDAEAYARQAALFLRRAVRDHLPMKLDLTKQTIRVYDPATNTFGSYRLDGSTRTFFRPGRDGYWDDQSGELISG